MCEIYLKLTIKKPVSSLLILNKFYICSAVFIVAFEQLNVGWVAVDLFMDAQQLQVLKAYSR